MTKSKKEVHNEATTEEVVSSHKKKTKSTTDAVVTKKKRSAPTPEPTADAPETKKKKSTSEPAADAPETKKKKTTTSTESNSAVESSNKSLTESNPDKKSRKQTTKKSLKKDHAARLLIADKNGISLAPVRIRNIILNVVFNRQAITAEAELKVHEKELLVASNLKNGYESFHKFTEDTRNYIKELRHNYLRNKRTQYERSELAKLTKAEKGTKKVLPDDVVNLLNKKRSLLKLNSEASLTDLFTSFNKDFYDGFTEKEIIDKYTGETAFKFYKSLISKDKIRLSDESRLRLTCFLELILKQFVSQTNINCVQSGNKTINLKSLNADNYSNHTYLSVIVNNLQVWRNAMDWELHGRNKQIEQLKNNPDGNKKVVVPSFVDVDRVNPNNKYKLKSFIVDICRNVNRHLVDSPPKGKYPETLNKQNITETFASLNMSNDFKEFCTQTMLELIYNFGSTLRTILRTRKDRTVDKNLVDAVISAYHISFSETDNLEKTFHSLDKMAGAFYKAQDVKKKEADAKPKKNNLKGKNVHSVSAN